MTAPTPLCRTQVTRCRASTAVTAGHPDPGTPAGYGLAALDDLRSRPAVFGLWCHPTVGQGLGPCHTTRQPLVVWVGRIQRRGFAGSRTSRRRVAGLSRVANPATASSASGTPQA